MSADEELELREFCETSSWETTSAASEGDPTSGVGRGTAFHHNSTQLDHRKPLSGAASGSAAHHGN